MTRMFNRSLRGVKLKYNKNTEESRTEILPVPDKVFIVMAQHMGKQCDVLVSPADQVYVGQEIGTSDAVFSTSIHSSVSGKVLHIDEFIMPNGERSQTVVIETDKLQTLHESIKPPVVNNRDDFLNAIKNSGMVGLGGAGFPTHVKFAPENVEAVDTLIVNGAECEPYITSDYRTVMEQPEDVIDGIKAIMAYLDIKKCIIGLEDNTPKAIKKMRELTKDNPHISVKVLKTQYPQGAEKVMIYELTRRVVKQGGLPSSVGVLVSNITTVASISRYLKDGIPLVSKRITVDGGAIAQPKNVLVPVGTPIADLAKFCGGYKAELRKILMGGPMMGVAVYDDSYPVIKNNNSILFLDKSQVEDYDENPCIRCGRCMRACPMNLMPTQIEDAFSRSDTDELMALNVDLCIECGCCAWSCPSKRHLVQVHRLSKKRIIKERLSTKRGAI